MSEQWEYGGISDSPGGSPADPGAAAGLEGFPWPPAEDESPLAAFGETWKSATFEPGRFFGRVPREDGTGAALVYYLVLVLIVAGATLFWESVSLVMGPLEDSALGGEMGLEAVSPLVGFLLTPVILLVMLFLSAAVTHGLLSLFNGGRHGFGTTLRVFCYAYSPGLFGVIPLIGGVVGSVWMVVLLIIGLRQAHAAEGWKAALAVLLPFALLLGIMILAFMMVLAAGAALLGG